MKDSPPYLVWRVLTWSSLVQGLNATFGLDFRRLNLEICKLQIPTMESEFFVAVWREKLHEEEEKNWRRERKTWCFYTLILVKVKMKNGLFSLVDLWWLISMRWPPLGCHLWVSQALNCCTVLRAIASVSGSQVPLVSGTAFSKHRQTIYQNAQNYILIIV